MPRSRYQRGPREGRRQTMPARVARSRNSSAAFLGWEGRKRRGSKRNSTSMRRHPPTSSSKSSRFSQCKCSSNSEAQPTQGNISTRPPSCNSNNRNSLRAPSLGPAVDGVRGRQRAAIDEDRTTDFPSTPLRQFHRRHRRTNAVYTLVSSHLSTHRSSSRDMEDSLLTRTLFPPVLPVRDEEATSSQARELFNPFLLALSHSMDTVQTHGPAPSAP